MATTKTYRFRFSGTFVIMLVIWFVIIAKKAYVTYQYHQTISVWEALYWSLFAERYMTIVWLVLFPLGINIAYPVKVGETALTAYNQLGLWVTIPYADLSAPELTRFFGIRYYRFRSKSKPGKKLYIATYLDKLAECMAEIEKRRAS